MRSLLVITLCAAAVGCGGAMSEASYGGVAPPAPAEASAEMAGGDAPLADGPATEAQHDPGPGDATTPTPELVAVVTNPRPASNENPAVGAATLPAENAPLMIYTARVGMEVEEVSMAHTIDQIIDAAVAAGGYLAGRDDRAVTVRVPSRAFRASLASIEQLGRITSRNVTADDVSAEFHDLEVRLVNLRALRARFEQLLQRAGNMDEILRVEQELERVAREIDGMEGRLRFLRSRISFSVLTVTLTAPPPPPVVVVAPPPPPPPAAPPPPPRRVLALPIPWLAEIGVEALINLGDPS